MLQTAEEKVEPPVLATKEDQEPNKTVAGTQKRTSKILIIRELNDDIRTAEFLQERFGKFGNIS